MAVNLLREAHLVAKFDNTSKHLLALLDMRAAFNRVKLDFLLHQLNNIIANTAIRTGVANYLLGKTGSIKFGGRLFKPFPIQVGIGQGSPLSNTCFAIFINELLVELDSKLKGIFIPLINSRLKVIAYADDVALILNDNEDLRTALDVIEVFAAKSGLMLNKDKSAIYVLKNFVPSNLFPNVGKQKFLGLPFPFFNHQAKSTIQNQLLGNIKNILQKIKFVQLSLISRVELVNKLCIPKLAYLGKFFTFTKRFFSQLDSVLSNFLWSGRLSLISKRTLAASSVKGGLNLIIPELYLRMLRANLYYAWFSYLERTNLSIPFSPQDTPPPCLQRSDFLRIFNIRLDILDDLPLGSEKAKFSFALVRQFYIDNVVCIGWGATGSFLKLLRRCWLPPNIMSFCFKVAHGRLATRELLVQRFNMNIVVNCEFCHSKSEDLDHILLLCAHFKPVISWLQDCIKSDILMFQNVKDLLGYYLNYKNLFRFVLLGFHLIWRLRCLKIFHDMDIRPVLFVQQEMAKHKDLDHATMKPELFYFFWSRIILC